MRKYSELHTFTKIFVQKKRIRFVKKKKGVRANIRTE